MGLIGPISCVGVLLHGIGRDDFDALESDAIHRFAVLAAAAAARPAVGRFVADALETLAIKRCFGDHAKKLAVSSTKSMTGHLLGAAGGIEAVFSALALHDQVAPPTINLANQDPRCDLDYVPNTARRMPMRVVLSNSFGFGGTNGSLVLRKI